MTETLQLVEKIAVLAFLVSSMPRGGIEPHPAGSPRTAARLVLIALWPHTLLNHNPDYECD